MSERLLRARDVAERLDVSTETVLRWHRSGKLPGYRLATNVLRFREGDLARWLGEAREAPSVEEEVGPVHVQAPGAERSLASGPVHNRGGDDAC
jgi:excisionase family DNA binding protein